MISEVFLYNGLELRPVMRQDVRAPYNVELFRRMHIVTKGRF